MKLGVDHTRIFHCLQEPVLIINSSYEICEVNQTFCHAYGVTREEALRRHCYEVTHRYPVPCCELGTECPLNAAFESLEPCRLIHKHVLPGGTVKWEEVLATPICGQSSRAQYVIEELRDVTDLLRTRQVIEDMKNEMKILKGILPMCSHCHKVRDSDGNWHSVDTYIRRNTEAGVSHSVCPECMAALYPGL